MIFRWLVDEHLTLYSICVRLNEKRIPSPKGSSMWGTSTVARLLRNPAYSGKTYAFQYKSVEPKNPKKKNKRYSKVARQLRPAEEWIELPNVTPPIISDEIFAAAQEQLRRNFEKAKRNGKSEYLLTGHIRCGTCGRRFNGYQSKNHRSVTLRYRCAGKNRTVSLLPCLSRSVAASEIDNQVWGKIKEVLMNPDVLVSEIRRRKQANVEASQLLQEIALNEKRLETLGTAETRALRLHLYAGMSEEKLLKEVQRVKSERQRIQEENTRLKKGVEQTKQVEFDESAVLGFCETARKNIDSFMFEHKRHTLDALDITITVKTDRFAMSGSVPPTVSTPSR